MSPNFWGCRCCGSNVTHRVFTSDGELVWSWLHPGMTKSSTAKTLRLVAIDSGGRVISSTANTVTGNDFSFGQWLISDGTKTISPVDRITSQTHWSRFVPAASGNFYEAEQATSWVQGNDSDLQSIWLELIEDYIPVEFERRCAVNGSIDLSSDESYVCATFQRNITAGLGPVSSAGVIVFGVDGVFHSYVDERWKFWPISDGRRIPPGNARFDESGFVYLFFGSDVSLISDYGTNVGNVWVYDIDGVFVRAFSAAGVQSSVDFNGIIGDELLIGYTDTTALTCSATDGSLLSTVELSAYGERVQTLQCDRSGTVYAVLGENPSDHRQNVVAMDSELNIKWTFRENANEDSSFILDPVAFFQGLRCTNGHVVIGGSIKKKNFDPSQLVIFP